MLDRDKQHFNSPSFCPSYIALNLYPVDPSPSVILAMQYYFEVFACSILPRKLVPEGWYPQTFFNERFQVTMLDRMWFEATLAFIEAMKDMTLFGTTRRSKIVLGRNAQALNELRKRLSNELRSTFDEITILTITTLMATEIVSRDFRRLRMHVGGLEQILTLRGGLDTLSPYLKHKVIGFQNFWLNKQMSISSKLQNSKYPRHPFPPELCTAIAKMPTELSEMAVEGALHTALINPLADVCTIARRLSTGSDEKSGEDFRRLKCLVYELEELHGVPSMSALEMLIITAFCDFCLEFNGARKTHWLLVALLQVTCSHLLFNCIGYDHAHHKVLVWAAAMMVVSGEGNQQSHKLGIKILETCAKHHSMNRNFVIGICRSIIWHEAPTCKLDANFEYDHLSECQGSISISPKQRAEDRVKLGPFD